MEIGSKAEEAIPYCQKAITICNRRVHRLRNELISLSESTGISADSVGDKEAEIATLTGLSGELEKKASFPEVYLR